jgi:flagellar biosynthesis protein FlhA
MFRFVTTGAQDLVLILGMIGILLILFVPISTTALDFLLLTNISIALLILLITFYTEKPLEFSTFPSLLLMTTLFRLALNVSTTRLILQQGDAGQVIDAIGTHVVAGNYVIGLVIFFILIVVQYIVVTNGAQRVAEVAARFTLDSLPGKQMSIDADLNMGLIDNEEAKRRRSLLERESNFYGAMDGASKFVKGDAIAGIIIIIINIIGGLSIGIFQHDMSWSDALHKYTLLTVGDGIVTQIPSLIIAVASGIIITRAATDSRLGVEVIKQFGAHPKTIMIVIFVLLIAAMIPGIPLTPVLILISAFSIVTWILYKNRSKLLSDASVALEKEESMLDANQYYQEMMTAPFEVRLPQPLHEYFVNDEHEIERRVSVLRKNLASDFGFVLPTLTFKKDSKLKSDEYKIYIQGESIASGMLNIHCLLAINTRGERVEIEGEDTREPTYGLPAKWISHDIRNHAASVGFTIIEPDTVFLTHLQETCKRFASHFITRNEVEKIIESRKGELGKLVDDVIPNLLTYSDLQRVLQGLLNEQVPIKNISAIFDVIADTARSVKDPEELVEKCREKLKGAICDSLMDQEGKLHVITLYPGLERKLLNSLVTKDQSGYMLTPKEIDYLIGRIAKETERLLKANINPVMLCAAPIRKYLRKMIKRSLPLLKIISINEIDEKANVISAGIIEFELQEER